MRLSGPGGHCCQADAARHPKRCSDTDTASADCNLLYLSSSVGAQPLRDTNGITALLSSLHQSFVDRGEDGG